VLDIVLSTLFIILGFVFIAFQGNTLNKTELNSLRLLWCVHLFFAVIFYVYTRSNSADVNGYWKIAKGSTPADLALYISKGFGTNVMYLFNYFPAHTLDLSIFTGFMIYAFVSFIGVCYLYKTCIELIPYNTRFFGVNIFPLLLFFPSIHFWSAGPGKDALLFFSITMFGYALIKLNKRMGLALLSTIIAMLIRPHVLIILFAGFGVAFLLSMNVKVWKRLLIFILLAGVSIALLPTVLEYVSLDSITVENTLNRLDSQARNLSGDTVGSSVDIQSYPFILKIITFLFRPLFFDIDSMFTALASIENFILLLLTIKVLASKPIKTYRNAPVVVKSYLIFLLLGTLIFSFSLGNFGIILRMKNMFIPAFILYLLWALSYSHELKSNQVQKSN
tara:strand:+ start:8196 stop:9368 length:1173 start_codon:yes stop_codon:yes gene_type:complete